MGGCASGAGEKNEGGEETGGGRGGGIGCTSTVRPEEEGITGGRSEEREGSGAGGGGEGGEKYRSPFWSVATLAINREGDVGEKESGAIGVGDSFFFLPFFTASSPSGGGSRRYRYRIVCQRSRNERQTNTTTTTLKIYILTCTYININLNKYIYCNVKRNTTFKNNKMGWSILVFM